MSQHQLVQTFQRFQRREYIRPTVEDAPVEGEVPDAGFLEELSQTALNHRQFVGLKLYKLGALAPGKFQRLFGAMLSVEEQILQALHGSEKCWHYRSFFGDCHSKSLQGGKLQTNLFEGLCR
uniref:(northern house mosquito) hypothetical protein n=1 Tax=Culex pipiens TaxID=7175 RepID=A0A8D8EZU4_CULPI